MKLFSLRSLKKPKPSQVRPPEGLEDARCYAIGDVHGRLDLLKDLLARIAEDNATRGPVGRTFIVFVGDLIDRGPDSRGVLDLLRADPAPFARLVFLLGNHEEMLLRALDAEPHLIADWLQFGGLECAQSYGVEVGRLFGRDCDVQADELRAGIPAEDLEFLRGFGDSFRFGDYLFVHAGIRPGVPIEEQEVRDLRWIRDGFLDSDVNHGVVVVHGHTIVDAPQERGNRIAIDTGAYRTGRLTALGLEGAERWYLFAGGEPTDD